MAGYDLKNEEHVKEYLKNLFTEYKFGCYSEKNPEVCHLLGDYYESLKKDFAKAGEIYQNNCDNLDYGRSCAKFGGYKLVGKGCEADMKTAFGYMKKGCELNDQVGCTNAGIVGISSSEIHTEDKASIVKNAISMLNKACTEFKTEKACFYLSGVYIRGIDGIVEKNPVEAYKNSLKACEYGNPFACANVAYMHTLGEGAQKNTELAEVFKKRALELQKEIKEVRQQIKFGQGIDT